MKRFLILPCLLIAITLSGCCSTKYIDVPIEIKPEFESVPERELLKSKAESESIAQFLLGRIEYYSNLSELWESWAISVYESIDVILPESLQRIKDSIED